VYRLRENTVPYYTRDLKLLVSGAVLQPILADMEEQL
jgi:hypothetical protein